VPTYRPSAGRVSASAQRLVASGAARVRAATPDLANTAAWVTASLALLLFGWSANAMVTQGGLDPSWHAALHVAAHQDLTFGSELVFTYGPLGFLSAPEFWYGDTGTLALIYKTLFRLALGIALYVAARRTYGAPIGLLLALVVAGTIQGETTIPVVAFVVLALVLQRNRADRLSLGVAGAAGALAGLELLVKLSLGIELTALAVVFALAVPADRVRHLGLVAGGMTAALLVGWAAMDQHWGALPEYAYHGVLIVSGYASALSAEEARLAWHYPAALLVIAIAIGGVLVTTHHAPLRQRGGLVVLWLAFAFLSFKQGFVRHDIHHAVIYFEALLGGFLALQWPPGRRALGFAVTILVLLVVLAVRIDGADEPIGPMLDPVHRARSAIDELSPLFSTAERREAEAFGRFRVLLADKIDKMTLALLQNHTVDVLPHETAVVWAAGLRWAPRPIFQSYSAYTEELDALNERTVTSRHAAERILLQNTDGIDGRFLSFDEPASTRAVLCRYVEMRATTRWLVLRRGPDRCGEPRLVRSVRADWGEPVAVPSPPNRQAVVYVRIDGVEPHGLESVRALLFKPSTREILLDGARYRLVPGTAANGLVLRAPARVDFTRPFNVAPNASRIELLRDGKVGSGGQPLHFDFYTESISPPP
jgi:hypothetical protein